MEKQKIINNINANKENSLTKDKKTENSLIEKNKTAINFSENSNIINIRNNNHMQKQPTETKVINNTTNINIINYNNISSPGNNIIEIHNNSIEQNISNNSMSKNKKKNLKEIKNNNNNNNNILINNSMIIKVSNSNQKDKINKIEITGGSSQNGIKLKSFNNNFPSNLINKSINMNNSLYNYPLGNKKSLSVNKFLKLKEQKNMTLLNNYPNIMSISLSQGKTHKLNNISSTFYNNEATKNIIPKKMASINNNSNGKSHTYDKNVTKKNQYNYMSLLSNNTYFGGYKTFFNKNNSNDKYNYDINTNYFKDEQKKYNNSPIHQYYNNVIDENEEYNDGTNSSSIKTKNVYSNSTNKYLKKKHPYDGKKNGKIMTKNKDNKLYGNIIGGKFNNKKLNGYGTLYNNGYGYNMNNIQLPQLIKIYNQNSIGKNRNNDFYSIPYKKY